MANNSKISKVGYTIISVTLFCFLYFILWLIFKEKMPLHEYLYKVAKNYDYYAEKIIYFLPLGIFTVVALLLMRSTPSKRFLKLQASLPTSKINSLAMGIVEIEGKLIMKDPLISPVGKKECIGYHYTIENINRDSDGKDSYSLIHQETVCNNFQIKDETGAVDIESAGIELVLLKDTNSNSYGNKRYTEILLTPNKEMLLVGYADSNNGISFIRKDDHYKILGITSAAGISAWNKYQPLLRSFLFISFFILLFIIFILLQ